jgi:hypothetical protein
MFNLTPTVLTVQQFGLSPTKPLNIKTHRLESSHSLASKQTMETMETMETYETAIEMQESHNSDDTIHSDPEEGKLDGASLQEPPVQELTLYDDGPTPRVIQRGFSSHYQTEDDIDEETPVVRDRAVFEPLKEVSDTSAEQIEEPLMEDPVSHSVPLKRETELLRSHSIKRETQISKHHPDGEQEADSSYTTIHSTESGYSIDAPPKTQIVESPELISLFLYALHAFDSSSLEQTNDSTICLSFAKGDVAYVHSVDPSGWCEVTLLKNLQRGWVPINFFTELVKDDNTLQLSKSRIPLKLLLNSTARFLNNPLDDPRNGDAIFSLDDVNAIRDGVRYLLELTNCLSRSTLIVKKRPIIRRMRKTLLADWYSLMIKADSYKHSHSVKHLETLHLMALQVVKKSITFLDIWTIESESLRKEEESTKPRVDIPTLRQPPFAKERLNEIHNMLFGYIGLLLGRLDMVEHNAAGCQILENITHQMILLLRELLYINKSCVQILNSRNKKLDGFDDNLDVLLALVSELVSSVKNFVTKTINETHCDVNSKEGIYQYTPEGDDLIGVVSKMTRSIAISVETCYKYLTLIGDFKLGEEKEYPDFAMVQITSEQFIKTCSVGMLKGLDRKKLDDLKNARRTNIKRQSRFSMIRGVKDSNFTESGSSLLQEFLPDSKSFIRNSVFQPYLNESSETYEIPFDPDSEIIRDSEGVMIGASFRALVFMLTDELKKPDSFFVSTFFLTFKLYSTGEELIEELIARFNLENKFEDDEDETGEYSSFESRIKNRRRSIAKMFSLWLQSYWDYVSDYNLVPTLINFFNEGLSKYLPIEAKKLIELCSKLIVVTPSKLENNKVIPRTTLGDIDTAGLQIVSKRLCTTRSSSLSHSSSVHSIASLNNQLDDEEHIFEEYELAKMNSNSRNSVLLPLPGLNFNNSSLLSKSQINDIEQVVMKYRTWLGTINWPFETLSRYVPIEVHTMLDKWYVCCQMNLAGGLAPELNLVDINAFELAKQLTIIESKIFLSIKPEELLNQNFTKRTHLSPNIQQSLMFTNLLSSYVLDSILEEQLPLKKRMLRLKIWLNIALSCYYLKNFNSLAAIVISLQSHILSRLEELWSLLPEKYHSLFRDLKKIIHPTNNYKGYRYKLDKVLKDGDAKAAIPVVPYINLFLQDLTFINEGNRDFRNSTSFLRSKIVNFDKFMRVSKIVSNMEFLQVGYDETPKKRRNSIFSFGSATSLHENLCPILPIQEYILLELLRVHQLNMRHEDRAWSMSKKLKP